jgi:hypothetical protein
MATMMMMKIVVAIVLGPTSGRLQRITSTFDWGWVAMDATIILVLYYASYPDFGTIKLIGQKESLPVMPPESFELSCFHSI